MLATGEAAGVAAALALEQRRPRRRGRPSSRAARAPARARSARRLRLLRALGLAELFGSERARLEQRDTMMPRPVSSSPTSDSSGASVLEQAARAARRCSGVHALEGEPEPARTVVGDDVGLDHERRAAVGAVQAEREPHARLRAPAVARCGCPRRTESWPSTTRGASVSKAVKRGDAAAVRAALGAAPLAARLRLLVLRVPGLLVRFAGGSASTEMRVPGCSPRRIDVELGVGLGRERIELDRHAPALAAGRCRSRAPRARRARTARRAPLPRSSPGSSSDDPVARLQRSRRCAGGRRRATARASLPTRVVRADAAA